MDIYHIFPISGKDSLATYLYTVDKLPPESHIICMFNDTGAEMPATLEWLAKVEAHIGRPIVRLKTDLTQIIEDTGMLPSPRMRFCTRKAKIEPMNSWLAGLLGESGLAVLYLGIRADEERMGYKSSAKNIRPAYPLQAGGLGISEVYKLVSDAVLLPPAFFWQEVFDRVEALVPSKWIETLKPWEHAHLFAWRSRANCYYCFFQRQYEYIGLHDHYPDLFWEAVRIEETVGAEGFTWRKNSMRTLLGRRDIIIDRRVNEICRALAENNNAQVSISREEAFIQYGLFDTGKDILANTSCGIFCAK